MVAAIFMVAVLFYNYVDIVTTAVSRNSYKEDAIEAIKINVEPKDRLGEIASAALDTIFTNKIDSLVFSKDFKYIAIDAEVFHELSNTDKQYLVNFFKKYNKKIIYTSKNGLKKLLLYNPITNSCNGGVLLTVDNIIELKDDQAVLQISYYVDKYDGAGYNCSLAYKDGRWEVQSTELRYIP